MQGEIVTTQTDDVVKLHGIYCVPVVEPKTRFDAVVLTHGLAGNFYSSRFLSYLSHTFLELGLHVVVGNTRGHDDVNRTIKAGRPVYLGAGYEKVSDCQFDLASWNKFLVSRGHLRNVYAGHSLGAIKSLYAHAHNPQPNVEAVIGLSATRLNYHQFMNSTGAELFNEMLDEARLLVDSGDSDQLMKVKFPFPTMMTAGAYLDKYGDTNQYDWLDFINQITKPCQLIFGELELSRNAAFEGLTDHFDELRTNNSQLSIEVIESADHFYGGRFAEAGELIRKWLASH